jgi:MoaA/NifB/PqqE/SkfB family radical SAM enzyme
MNKNETIEKKGEVKDMNLASVLWEKALKTGIRAFPLIAALSPDLAQLSARAVIANPKILRILERKRAVRRFGVSMIKKHPLYSQIHITSYCNHTCLMCNLWKKPVMLDYEDAIRALDISARMGAFIVNITGGEPLLHPQLIEIIAYAAKLQFLIHLNTNGTLPIPYFERLAKTPLDSMVISFLSINPKKYEMMTGSKAPLEKVIRTIEYLKEHSDFHIVLKYVITAYNSGETEEIV